MHTEQAEQTAADVADLEAPAASSAAHSLQATPHKPRGRMPLDAVSHLNPGWRCWGTGTHLNGYHAERQGYGRVSATSPEELHTQILVAEAETARILIRPVSH